MSSIPIDADALFRAVTAYNYKLLAYYLDLRSGEVASRTLTPEEVQAPPPGPRVPPLPTLGGDLQVRKGESPFGPLPEGIGKKPDLFKDDGPKKKAFEGDFWKKEGKKGPDPFGGEGYKPVSGTKKLAELFGEKPPETASDVRRGTGDGAKGASQPLLETPYVAPELDLSQPLQRIPPASEEQHRDWMRAFARDCGDPQIKEKLERALSGEKSFAAFERVLRNYQRLNQQWDRNYRKQALHYAEVWLKALPIQWEIVEPKE